MFLRLLVVFCALYFGLTRAAFAYVDPGILSVVYQAAYALFFGFAAAFILRPWNWLKSIFSKKRAEEKDDKQGHDNRRDDDA